MADFDIGGSWQFGDLAVTGLANSITADTVFYNTSTGQFTYGPNTGGAAFDPSFSYTISGNWVFNAGFDINSPNEISIVSTGAGNSVTIEATNDQLILTSDGRALLQSLSNNVFIQATASGQQVQIYADGFNFSSQQTANFNSVNADVNVNANSGNLNIGGLNSNYNVTNNLNIFTGSGGTMNINTTAGDLDIFAGASNTSGTLNLGAYSGNANLSSQLGGIGLNAQTDIDINSNTGTVNLSSSTSNFSVQVSGLAMGVAAGSGMNVDATTGNFSFGASTGSFLIGALANTVDIVSGTIMTLSASTQLDIEAANITLSLITAQTPVSATPLVSLPSGFAYVIMNTTTKQIFSMV